MSRPLWMPEGSVRAILLLIITCTVCFLSGKQIPIPENLWDILHMGWAFYFGMKVQQALNKKKEETE